MLTNVNEPYAGVYADLINTNKCMSGDMCTLYSVKYI